jgi:predicted acetyltransferase
MNNAEWSRLRLNRLTSAEGALKIARVELVAPCTRFQESFLRALTNYQAEGRYLDLDRDQLEADFAAYIAKLAAQANPELPVPSRRVPETTLWYVSSSEFLARISIRHWLTPRLRRFGGHIGYDVAPTARRQGHATRVLALAIPVARDLGIDQALLTCDVDNIASRKVIETNGGVLHDETTDRLRFWLPTHGQATG